MMPKANFFSLWKGLTKSPGAAIYTVNTVSAPSYYCPNPDSSIISMASSSGQNGIQLLLAAEQEAQHIVNAARTAKQARLKQAKEEAEKEIAQFRAQMEADFQKKVAESSGDSGANVKRLEQETDAKIQHLKTEASRISHDVVQMLLRHVTTVKN
ncbi:V-type proton ATPase subunit G 1-like [Olea europaea subsp. europaea]|uniref:V-type proton ATPase subunit G n=3 Tax=Olea europaea subsp. europaea TaxID=158383 RepID=A0A8S0S2Y9_OLEEU|nr:V-type proton ATPase subunit G 1-like [Olea europaea subsp. europaea]